MNWPMTITLIVIFIFCIIIAAWFVAEYGAEQTKAANEYAKKYAIIENIITKSYICEGNFDWIEKMFDNLLECKYKNPEMTEVLYNKFREKYEDIAKKRVNENA